MQKNNKGSSLLLSMGLVMITSLLAFAILEYIIPFSREIKGVENSSIAYYQANSGIEEALYAVYIRNNSGDIDDATEYSELDFSGGKNTKYFTLSSGAILPTHGEGNSKYDPSRDWNTIAQGNPIQLSVGSGMIDSGFKIAFRVPDLDMNGQVNDETLSGSSDTPIVNWQLSSNSDTLNASGSIITVNKILNSNETFDGGVVDLWLSVDSVNLSGNNKSFSSFYTNNCGVGSGCILKFSVVNKLVLGGGYSYKLPIPYLEWRIDTGGKVIPLRYTKITSSGKSYGYKKDLDVKVAGKTVNEAFDFTVFQ